MSPVTRHTYPGLQRHDAELQQLRGIRVATLRQEYDLLAANTNPTPWELRRRESLRLALGITPPKENLL